MVPVVVVRHLGEGKQSLGRVHYIKSAREARVLLQRFADAEQPRRHKHGKGQRHDDRSTHFTYKSVEEVVGPVVHVRRPRAKVSSRNGARVDVAPQKFIHVQVAVRPVHAKRKAVVVRYHAQEHVEVRMVRVILHLRVEQVAAVRHNILPVNKSRQARERSCHSIKANSSSVRCVSSLY